MLYYDYGDIAVFGLFVGTLGLCGHFQIRVWPVGVKPAGNIEQYTMSTKLLLSVITLPGTNPLAKLAWLANTWIQLYVHTNLSMIWPHLDRALTRPYSTLNDIVPARKVINYNLLNSQWYSVS